MLPDEKIVYPDWMSENGIITQLLNQVRSNGNRLPYSLVINDDHDSATNERMKKIIDLMKQEKLLMPTLHETADLELGPDGRRAALCAVYRDARIQCTGRTP